MYCVFLCEHERAFEWYTIKALGCADPGVASKYVRGRARSPPPERLRDDRRAASLIGGSKVTLRFVLAKLWIFAAEMSSRAAHWKWYTFEFIHPTAPRRWVERDIHRSLFVDDSCAERPLSREAREESNYHLLLRFAAREWVSECQRARWRQKLIYLHVCAR
jgi:hypothetical protein